MRNDCDRVVTYAAKTCEISDGEGSRELVRQIGLERQEPLVGFRKLLFPTVLDVQRELILRSKPEALAARLRASPVGAQSERQIKLWEAVLSLSPRAVGMIWYLAPA